MRSSRAKLEEGIQLPVRGEPLAPVRSLSGFRSVLEYARQPLARFEAARALSDRAVAFRVFGISHVLLFEPEAIEQVLVSQHSGFAKGQFTRDLIRVLGTGLLTNEGASWRERRKLIAPSFQRSEMNAHAPVMVECAAAFLRGREPGAVFDVHSALMHLALDILVRALFGARPARGGDVERLLAEMMADYTLTREMWRAVAPEWFPVPSRARLSRVRRELDAILAELIAERGGAAESTLRGRAGSPPNDLLARLMRADGGPRLSDAALHDEAMTLFLAGHETTALSLTYALYLLAQHPRESQRLSEELGHVLAGRAPTPSDLPQLPYLRAVLDEALRLYPPAWVFGREALADIDVCGIHLPRATQILICPWVLHRDPRFFADPLRFWPERWLAAPAPPRFAYLPFGGGPRVCVGNHFALVEAALVLATLHQRARFELAPQPPLEVVPTITLRPRRPVLMRMVPRSRQGGVEPLATSAA